MHNQVSRIALASAFLAIAAPSAWAIEADDFGTRVKEAARLLGISVDYATAEVAGDTVILSDFTLSIPGEDAIEVPGEMIFTGVTEQPDGGYLVARATIADIEVDNEKSDTTFSFRNVAVENIKLPGAIEYANLLDQAAGLYETLSAGPLQLVNEGNDVFAIDSIAVSNDFDPAAGQLVTSMAIEGIRGDFTPMPDPEAREVLAALGLEQFSASLKGSSSWDIGAGRISIDDFAFTLDELGTLRASGSALGYTRALYQDMMKITVKMSDLAEAGDDVDTRAISGLETAMFDLLSQLEIESAKLRYEDASLFMKVLDFVGAEQGVDGATFANGLKFMVPMLLVDVPNAAFKTSVQSAVNAFVDNPQSIELVAEPQAPVSIGAFEAVIDDPFSLIDLLNVSVRANQ